jgi:hypothetical protein
MIKQWLALTIVMTSMSAAEAAPQCDAKQVRVSVDDGQGRFDGMSHSGMLLKVTNEGNSACALPARPGVDFQDARHRSLRLSPSPTPGPTIRPVILSPRASATSEMRWVSGDVYDPSVCVTPAYVALRLDGGDVAASFKGRICGPRDKGATYRAEPFVLSR